MSEKLFKVVHISSSKRGGAGRAAFRLHNALLENNISSRFLSLDTEVSEEYQDCYSITTTPLTITKRIFKTIRAKIVETGLIDNKRERIIKRFSEIRPSMNCEIATLPFSEYDILQLPIVQSADIIHLHWVAGIVDYPIFFKNCNKPVIWTLHDMNPFIGLFHYKQDEVLNEGIYGKMDNQIKIIKKEAFKKIKGNIKVVTPSKWLVDEVIKSKMFARDNILTITNIIDTKTFFPSNRTLVRGELGIPDNGPVFIFAAHLITVRRKGFQLLRDALNAVKNKLTLIAIGDVDNAESINKDIIYTGIITDDNLLCKYYSAANAYILPSQEDNLPNVMLESFACGIPVISFAVGGMKEHVIPFKTGLLANSMTSEALKDAIEQFILHKDIFDTKLIREYAVENFNPSLQAEAYTSVYQQLLQ